jgi:hypothetical protein
MQCGLWHILRFLQALGNPLHLINLSLLDWAWRPLQCSVFTNNAVVTSSGQKHGGSRSQGSLLTQGNANLGMAPWTGEVLRWW